MGDAETDWAALPVERVNISYIRPMKLVPAWWRLAKVVLVMAHLLEPRNGDYVPHLVQWDSNVLSYDIEDGHHRINLLSLLGCRTVRARILPSPSSEGG